MSNLAQASASPFASSSQSATPSIPPTALHIDVLSQPVTAATPSRAGSVIETYPTSVTQTTNGNVLGGGTTPAPAEENVKVKVEAQTDASTSGQAGLQNGDGAHMNGKHPSSAPRKKLIANVDKVANEARRRSRLKGRGYYDEKATVESAARVAVSLVSDQNVALNPDIDTPFLNATDVIQRLLPWHVFQHPAEDIATLPSGNIGKGKRKATEEDLLREEIAETRFALECWKRRRTLEKRFRDARTSAAQRTAPDDQAYVLAQAILESDRHENAAISAELRAAKQELDKIEREKKAAAAAANPPTPRPTYYPNQQTTTPTTSAYPTQYRGYTYAYGQGYSSQYTYSPYQTTPVPANAWSTSVFSHTPQRSATAYATPTTPASTSAYPSTSTAAISTSTSAPTSTPVVPQQTQQSTPAVPLSSTSPIPVQLPVSSLTDLIALGIVPVPVSSAPPAGQPQPAAVLKGTSQNGQTVSLEINVSSLQGNQLSGLAMVLSTLTSRGVSLNAAASASASGVNGSISAAPASTQSAAGGSSGTTVASAGTPNVNGSVQLDQ